MKTRLPPPLPMLPQRPERQNRRPAHCPERLGDLLSEGNCVTFIDLASLFPASKRHQRGGLR